MFHFIDLFYKSIKLSCPKQPPRKSILHPIQAIDRPYICSIKFITNRHDHPLKNIQKTKNKNMENQDFTTTILVDQSPKEVFNAINNVRGWWSGEIDGDTDKPGAEFTYSVPDVHRSKQKITEFIPGKKVVWHVTDATLSFVKDKSEWIGTDIVFEIAEKGDKTEVRFTHLGLVPAFECYKDCSNAWGLLINGNLCNLVNTGKVQPSPWKTETKHKVTL